ncbi:MAG: type II toxin-antitoxin system HicB family antitoxin [Candidatus Magnetominusculus sp. LBB02]|nr:type II toxin-antitoxin system HicB family antitoxin [Candidatus Magnetominusculus sp. LBB02]
MTASMIFNLPVKFKQKKDIVIASCPILDVVTQGETVDEARKNIKEAVTLFVLSCIDDGTLEAVLKECGFTTTKMLSKRSVKTETISVLIPFTIKSNSPAVCHA